MPGSSRSKWPAAPGSFCSISATAASTSISAGTPLPPSGGMVKNPNRNPPSGGKYVLASGLEPASGKVRVESAPQTWWNSLPGIRASVTGATRSSLTKTELPSAPCPVATRRMSMLPPRVGCPFAPNGQPSSSHRTRRTNGMPSGDRADAQDATPPEESTAESTSACCARCSGRCYRPRTAGSRCPPGWARSVGAARRVWSGVRVLEHGHDGAEPPDRLVEPLDGALNPNLGNRVADILECSVHREGGLENPMADHPVQLAGDLLPKVDPMRPVHTVRACVLVDCQRAGARGGFGQRLEKCQPGVNGDRVGCRSQLRQR